VRGLMFERLTRRSSSGTNNVNLPPATKTTTMRNAAHRHRSGTACSKLAAQQQLSVLHARGKTATSARGLKNCNKILLQYSCQISKVCILSEGVWDESNHVLGTCSRYDSKAVCRHKRSQCGTALTVLSSCDARCHFTSC